MTSPICCLSANEVVVESVVTSSPPLTPMRPANLAASDYLLYWYNLLALPVPEYKYRLGGFCKVATRNPHLYQ